MHILLQPINHIQYDVLNVLESKLPDQFPDASFVMGKSMELPSYTYDKSRKQYVSPSILEYIQKRCVSYDVVLGICDVDAYSHGLNFVFGEAYDRVCVIYLRRLRDEFYGLSGNLFLERVVKEAVHELGHAFGLGHCYNSRCVMISVILCLILIGRVRNFVIYVELNGVKGGNRKDRRYCLSR